MRVRHRPEADQAGIVAGTATAVGLLAAAVVHAAWARGSTWPRRTHDELADLVVGRRPFPSRGMCWTVAGLLSTAAASVAAQSTARGAPPALHRLTRLGAATTAAALSIRGAGGLLASGLGLLGSTDEFRRRDLQLYSPLCLALGAGAALAARSARPTAART